MTDRKTYYHSPKARAEGTPSGQDGEMAKDKTKDPSKSLVGRVTVELNRRNAGKPDLIKDGVNITVRTLSEGINQGIIKREDIKDTDRPVELQRKSD
tara:strand:+ start:153 stop:443 length:291 start_codon:yes stop_codon:yes gene_type:complete